MSGELRPALPEDGRPIEPERVVAPDAGRVAPEGQGSPERAPEPPPAIGDEARPVSAASAPMVEGAEAAEPNVTAQDAETELAAEPPAAEPSEPAVEAVVAAVEAAVAEDVAPAAEDAEREPGAEDAEPEPWPAAKAPAAAAADAAEPEPGAEVAAPQPGPGTQPVAIEGTEPEPGAEVAEPEPMAEPVAAAAAPVVEASITRRAFLGFALAIGGGLAGAAALTRLFPVFEDGTGSASPIVPAYDPAGKAWTFVVDTASCIGCGMCVVACKEENHVPEEAAYTRTWVERHVTTADGAAYVDAPDAGMYGFPAQSTAPGAAGKTVTAAYFEPRLCMQCQDSPCTAVCPVGATYRTEDGVVLVDSRRCIGCGYCVVACPYGARYIVPAGSEAPNDTPGVADKCTWCYHRISRGAKPACVEVCPVGARKFGDAADPASDIATLVRERQPVPLDPEYGTRPRVLYLGPAVEEA